MTHNTQVSQMTVLQSHHELCKSVIQLACTVCKNPSNFYQTSTVWHGNINPDSFFIFRYWKLFFALCCGLVFNQLSNHNFVSYNKNEIIFHYFTSFFFLKKHFQVAPCDRNIFFSQQCISLRSLTMWWMLELAQPHVTISCRSRCLSCSLNRR